MRNIKKDCGKFLKDADSTHPVFRGMKNPNYELLKKVVRKVRRPRDTDRNLSEIFDEILLSITGIRGRTQTGFSNVMTQIYDSIPWEAYRPILYHAFEQLFKKIYQVVDSFALVDDSRPNKPELMIVCDAYYAIPTGYRFDEFGELNYDALLNKINEN